VNAWRLSGWQILVIAHHTLREARRQRLVGCLVALALAFALGARWLRDFNFGTAELDFLLDCGFGAMAFFGAALSITATAQLFLGEIEHRSVLFVLARPVGRAGFVLGKFLGITALLAGFCAALGLLMGFTLWWRATELSAGTATALETLGSITPAGLAAGIFLQWLKLSVLAGFVMLVASFARTQLFTLVVGVFLLVVFHLQFVAQEAWARGGSWIARALGSALARALPNFHLFAFDRDTAAHGDGFGIFLRLTAYGIGYLVLVCALTVFSFRHREL
jgi:ABC-type transport system involved in multi-copper enzyme maturation permease subunit